MIWFGKTSKKDKNHKVDDRNLFVNNEAETESEREKKLQEIDEHITVILPIIRKD